MNANKLQKFPVNISKYVAQKINLKNLPKLYCYNFFSLSKI